jgi:hypothetical protein
MSDHAASNAAAMANWYWLTGLTRANDALHLGEPASPLGQALHRHFSSVTDISPSGPGGSASIAAVPAASVDFIAGPGAVQWWDTPLESLLGQARRVLRADGWLALAGPTRAGRGADAARVKSAARRAGFRQIRGYALAPSYDRPLEIIPRTRAAMMARERHHARLGGSAARVAVAWAGLPSLLYRGWLILASPQ